MTTTIPYRPGPLDPRSIDGILSNFDALIAAIDSIVSGAGADLPGVVKGYAGSTAPTGYLMCDGSAVLRADYPGLFGVLGTAYGAGNGTTTFNLPDFRGRVPVGEDGIAGRLNGIADTRGGTGGFQKHTLLATEMPIHNHVISRTRFMGGTIAHTHSSIPGYVSEAPSPATGVGSPSPFTDNAGSGGPHENMQPYQILNWIIKT
jgi:microcystin-dependent protein